MTSVRSAMAQGAGEGVFPGAVLLASRGGKIVLQEAVGKTRYQGGLPVTMETLFDLASLTKPLATALGIMLLIQEGKLSLFQTLGEILPASRGGDKAFITLDQLLRHTSGLPAHRPYYIKMMNHPWEMRRGVLRQAILDDPLEAAPGAGEIYSDPGYVLLAWVVETVSGCSLSQWVEEKIYSPLGIRDFCFINTARGDRCAGRVASTEECPWRGRLLTGEVHDDNAWAAGGIEGHAGLFGTAPGVHTLLMEVMKTLRRDGDLLSPDLLTEFVKRRNGFTRGAGFDFPSARGSSAGRYLSRGSIGHLGFTGTSFWLEQTREIIVVLLTNRVHPSRENEKIRIFRPMLHDLVMEKLGAVHN